MTERFSLDSNVLIYSVDAAEGERQNRALEILDLAVRGPCVLTTQALGEFAQVASRKRLVDKAMVLAQVRDWSAAFDVIGPDLTGMLQGLELWNSKMVSVWDAILLATVESAGCTLLLSEDLHDGGRFGGVTVLNPFKGKKLPKRVATALGLR
ncbi:MAG: PIN domain-containing protein [Alphaproteobacteria bacterium]|nr:PIN domain-containing protein [Alphaproteobacteria bacterium]